MADNIVYHDECRECDNLYHCFGREAAENILEGNPGNLVRIPTACRDFYPERKG